jgi:hypothetical protein
MERTGILELMSRLKLFGMRSAGACPRAGRRPDPGDAVMGSVRNFVRRLGMIGAKESDNAATQRTSHT